MPLPQRELSVEVRGWTSAKQLYAEDEEDSDAEFYYLDEDTAILGSHHRAAECTWLAIIHNNEPAVIYTPTHIYVIPPERVESPDISAVLNRYLPSDLPVQFLCAGSYEMAARCDWQSRGSPAWADHHFGGRITFGNGVRMLRIERSS